MSYVISATRKRIVTIARRSIIGIFIIWTLFPILWMILTSFKTRVDIFSMPPKFIFNPTPLNYLKIFSKVFERYYWNSIFIGTITVILSVAFGSLAGYSFSRFKFRGTKMLPMIILVTRMLPAITIIFPLYIIMKNVGLLGTHWGVALAHTSFNLPFATWMMIGFFDGIPEDLDSAAMVDGCSRVGAFLRVVLPLAAPGLAATAILCLLLSWNEFLFALILTGAKTKTLPVIVAGLLGFLAVDWGGVTAAGTIIMAPMLAFSLVIRKHLVRGLTMGAVKG